jgi:hypothetical protein
MAPDVPPRRLEYVPVEDLPDHPENPSDHDEAELRASLLRFGFTTPPMLCERTGLLAEGHGRKKVTLALWAEGADPPPGVLVDGHQWLVPVVRGWSSANDDELRAYLLASNYRGGWRNDALADLLVQLAANDGGLVGTGYSADGLDDLLAELGAGELPDQGTDAAHAPLTARGEPADPREVQGLHEVGLMFQASHHAEYLQLVAELRRREGWNEPTPLLVLRALRLAAEMVPA